MANDEADGAEARLMAIETSLACDERGVNYANFICDQCGDQFCADCIDQHCTEAHHEEASAEDASWRRASGTNSHDERSR